MKSRTAIKLAAWALAIVLNFGMVLMFFALSGLDGGFQTQLDKGADAVLENDYDKAVKHYLKAVSIAPDSPVGYLNAADVYVRMNKPQEAVALMEQFIEKSPRSTDSFELLLSLYQSTNTPIDRQIDLLTKAAALFEDPSYADRAGKLRKERDAVQPPVPDKQEGAYENPIKLLLTNLSEGDSVYYTSNGDLPTTGSTKYNAEKGISLSRGRTQLRMVRYDKSGNSSQVVSYSYTVGKQLDTEALKAYTAQNGANLSTGGVAVFGGSDTFFSNLNQSGYLYSLSAGQLATDKASYLNLREDTIYYVNGSDNSRVYKIKKDGTARALVNSDACGMLQLAGNRLFYQNKSDSGSLYSMALDGSDKKRLVSDLTTSFAVYQGFLYYRNDTKLGALYKCSMDGFDQLELVPGSASCINVYDDNIYFINAGDDARIYRVGLAGGTPAAITSKGAAEFVLSGGNLYFRAQSGDGIYRCSASGGGATKLTGDDGGKLSVAGGTIYYVNYSDDSRLYSMSTTGTNASPVS